METLIRSYIEEAVTNGESWDSDEDPNDRISAQDLLDYFDEMVMRLKGFESRVEELEAGG